VTTAEEMKIIRENLWHCVEHIARVSRQTGRKLHLGLEPEPLCILETTTEAVRLFERLRAEHRNDPGLSEHLGVNYDTCHLAVEFEQPQISLTTLQQHGIKISKLHLSSALKVMPTPEARAALSAFAEDTYLHQVVLQKLDGKKVIYRDLDVALACKPANAPPEEWRIHFHVPLHSPPTSVFQNTTDHLLGALDVLGANPGLCSHLEMETYTWEVLPREMKTNSVVDQLAAEYEWTLARLAERGLYSPA
jgi:hypothetical protein